MTSRLGVSLILAIVAAAGGATSGLSAGEPDWPLLGAIKPRSAAEVSSSTWSIGGETLDRDFAVYANYKSYLGRLGAKGIRLQAGWAKCEKQPGVYDWAWLDAIIDDALARGVRPWVETSYGNAIHPGGGGTGLAGGLPTSPEALAAWDNWVRALVRRYKDRVDQWEVWNEPDIGKANSPEQYAALFLRTAEIIRAEQAEARIYALGLAGNMAFAEKFLEQVKQQGKLGLIDAVTIHGYPRNPDDTSNIDRLRAIIARTGREIEVRQGETGAPSKFQESFALSKIAWSENTQAKWDLRRMLAHHGRGVAFSLFSISDMHYRRGGGLEMNYKGLLATNADQTIARPKLAYFAAQRVFTIFDDSLKRVRGFACRASIDDTIAAFGYAGKQGGHLVAIWLSGAPPAESNAATPADLVFTGVRFDEPVYADLLTGKVYALPNAAGGSSFRQVPLHDWPILIADRALVPLDPR
jgi:hypothetical protein